MGERGREGRKVGGSKSEGVREEEEWGWEGGSGR